MRDAAWGNGFLAEDTFDWFSQDTDGNVWYLGESTTEFEYDDEDNFIGTSNKGSWEAGVNEALPGYIMEANPKIGDNYFQEFAPNDEALDRAKVVGLGGKISTESGNYSNVLKTLESTELETGLKEFKFYAPGVGLVANKGQDISPQLTSINSVTPDAFTDGNGTKGNDVLDGDNGSNTLKGRQGDDLLQGFDGKDRLLGQDGNDFLIGGNGLDVLTGGNGQDILVGGEGADCLTGGKDRDQFVFRTLEDMGDSIVDFTRKDIIVLAEIFDSEIYGSANPLDDYLQFEQMGSSTVIRIDPDGDKGSNLFDVLATLNNTNANVLSDSSFVV